MTGRRGESLGKEPTVHLALTTSTVAYYHNTYSYIHKHNQSFMLNWITSNILLTMTAMRKITILTT